MNLEAVVGIVIVVATILFVFLLSAIKIVQEYERGVIFRLGRCVGAKGPGLFLVIPFIDKIIKVNLQVNAVAVTPQQVITRDNVTVSVDAVAYVQVVEPSWSVVRVRDWWTSAQLVAQTTLRSVVGRHELDELLAERDRIDAELQQSLDLSTEPWGVKVHRVEIRDVGLPEQMQRAMARQAEAERERRAKVIAAEGELQASQKLGEAARVIGTAPGALQLRQLQTMVEISAERNSTIIFPIPTEILEAFKAVGSMQTGRIEAASPTEL
jgi:regulator of protease activity HflC (stomatin/prohibitin superfamily)